jgi:hypothetical protein
VPTAHALPHIPQFAVLVVRSTHAPEHEVVVPVQTALPPPLTAGVPPLPLAPPVPTGGFEDVGGPDEVPHAKISSGAAAKTQAQRVPVRIPKTWHRFHNIPSGKLPLNRARERNMRGVTNFDRYCKPDEASVWRAPLTLVAGTPCDRARRSIAATSE